jgi:hypothetical protein
MDTDEHGFFNRKERKERKGFFLAVLNEGGLGRGVESFCITTSAQIFAT